MIFSERLAIAGPLDDLSRFEAVGYCACVLACRRLLTLLCEQWRRSTSPAPANSYGVPIQPPSLLSRLSSTTFGEASPTILRSSSSHFSKAARFS